jgi:hypothetical protein
LKQNGCLINRSSLPLQVRISTENLSRLAAITSSACVPIEPVEPKIAMRLIVEELFMPNVKGQIRKFVLTTN